MTAQRERARAASQFGAQQAGELVVNGNTEFSGYQQLEETNQITALYQQGQPVDTLAEGTDSIIVLNSTPFYAESGGQVGDTGALISQDGAQFVVTDTRKQTSTEGTVHLHFGHVQSGRFQSGTTVTARVDSFKRQATALNHSATHLMHAALRQVLGTHVQQKGSLVDAERLRFDFSHFEPMIAEQLDEIERLVNEQIRNNNDVETNIMPLDDAVNAGALALFGEKYDDEVRVLRMGEFSTELCGGTHVKRLGDIGLFKIAVGKRHRFRNTPYRSSNRTRCFKPCQPR